MIDLIAFSRPGRVPFNKITAPNGNGPADNWFGEEGGGDNCTSRFLLSILEQGCFQLRSDAFRK